MAPKRKKEQSEEREDSPAPSLTSKRRKKSLQYDPLEICHELYEIIRNHKSEEGRIICESFIRAPKRRTAADYYEVVETPIDLLKIQQKLKMEEYEDLEQLTSDIELMVNNAKSYYKKGTPEYKDACDLWDLYIESKNEVISEAFGETPSERRSHRRSLTATLGDEDAEEKVRAIDESSNDSSMLPTTIASGEADDPEDMEQLFAAVMVAKDGEREISPVFQLLPSKVKYPEYYKIIKQPIDLKMIAQKLIDGGYKTMDEMEKDFFVLTKNAKIFNEPKSQIYKDAITLKKVVQSKKVELQQARAKATPKPSGSIRTRERTSAHRWSTYCASLEYPQEEQIPDISLLQEDSLNSSQVDFDEDSGSETIISEDGDPLWVLLNHVRSAKGAGGVPLSEPFLKLPSRRFYPDYYDEVKRPMSISNVRKKLKYKQYKNLDKLASDLNLVFENAKQYNADESKIYKDACLLQKIMSDKKFELEHGDTKKTPDFFDEDSRSRGRKSISLNLDSDKKKTKRASPEEMMRRRLWMIYKAVFEYTDKDGRHLREIFMELPSKRDYPDYYQVILNPMDMLTIESKIKAEKYTTEQELIADFELMFNNARHYNEEHSLVYSDANTLEKIMKNKWKNLCQTIEARRALSKNMSFSPKSNQLGNSPKDAKMRMIRAANTPLPTRLQELYNTIHNYQDVRGRNLATPFLKLPLKAEYPDYYEVIKKPIDMQRIQQKMLSSQYESVEDMVADFVQMFDNACKYNEPDSLIYKDALTLQRVCLEKKTELCHDGADVPDVRAAVVEIMTSLFIATYNFQDEEGRCYSDSFAELPERDPDEDLVTSKTKEKPLSFDQIKKNLDRGRYARMDKFQEDMFSVFERARRLSRLDSQLYEDAVEMQTFFIETRDKMCHNGELLLTPALSYTEKHLHAALESEKLEKQPLENQGMEDKKLKDPEENHDMPSEGGVESFRYKEEEFKVGDFVYIEPREKGLEPHIMLVEKLFVDANNVQSIHGNWFYRPNETFHVSTRKFLEKEVLKSDSYTSTPLSQVIGKCYVMYVKDYFKMKPENFQEQDVYVCENRYNAKHKFFKKIKIWQVPKNDSVVVVSRDIPLVPIRVTSVFADKEKDEILDDGDTSPLDKKRIDVPVEVPNGEEGAVYYDQLNTQIGTLKLGDSVYISSNREKQLICRIDKMWTNKMGQSYVCGPWFVYPCDIEHSPTRMFYKHEIFLSSCEDSVPIQNLSGKCCVLHMKDYLISRPTEISEEDVFVCECKYFELEKSLKKLGKGLKKYVLSPRVTDDEVYFFRKHVTLQKEPSPLLLRVHDDNSNSMFGLEAEESQDGDNDNTEDSFNMSISTETVPVPETKPQKKSDDTEHTKEKVQKKGKGSSMKRQISGYIIYSGEIRKTIQNENPECSFGEISRIVGLKERSRRLPSAYILFSKDIRNVVLQENPNITFGEISRVIGVKWRNLSKEDKERYEEKAKRVAEEQQAKQQEAEKAFNESLNRSQSPWDAGRMSPGSSKQGASTGFQGHFGIFHSPGTPNQGQHVNMQGLPGSNQAGMMPRPGMSPMTPGGHRPFVPFGQQGMTPVGMGPYQGSPQGQASPLVTPQSLQPGMSPGPNPGTLPGYHTGMNSSTHAALPPQASMGQGQQMAPPPPPPRPPSPMFTTAPPRTQRLLHSEAYLRYIEGLKADRPHISDWEKTFTATPENTITDESRLPTHWLGEGAGYHGNRQTVDA